MTPIFLTIGIFAAAMTAMAVGVILSNRELHGSCGGSDKDCICEIEKRRACAQFKPRKKSLSLDLGGLANSEGRQDLWRQNLSKD